MRASYSREPTTNSPVDFHFLKEYVELQADWTGTSARFVQVVDSDGALVTEFPVLIAEQDGVKSVSSPYGYAGPAAKFFRAEAMSAFQTMCIEEGWSSAFLRCHPIYGQPPESLNSSFGRVVVSGTLAIKTLAISGEDDLLASYSKGLRRDVRRGRREPISVFVQSMCAIDLVEFGDLYSTAMVRLEARSALRFTADYLRRFADAMGQSAFVVRCVVDDQLVAAGSFVVNGSLAHYHLSAANYDLPLAGYAMKLTVHKGLIECHRRGADTVNLGGGLGGSRDGLFEFKSRFASREVDYKTFRMYGDPDRFRDVHGMDANVALELPMFPPPLV